MEVECLLLDHALIISYTKVKLVKLFVFSLGAANLFACLLFAVAAHSDDHYANSPWRPDGLAYEYTLASLGERVLSLGLKPQRP